MASEDLVTVWSGAIETAAVRAQQLGAPIETSPQVRDQQRSDRAVLLAWLHQHPWSSMREMHAATCLSMRTINETLHLYARRGDVLRSHWQHEDRHTPVRWKVVTP